MKKLLLALGLSTLLMGCSGDEVGDDTEEQLVQETMFKQKVVAKDFSILLNNLIILRG